MNAPLDISIVYRADKGSKLTADEVDANFKAIVDVLRLFAQYGGARGIGFVEFDEDSGLVTIVGTDNSVLGTFKVPPRPWTPKGSWLAGTGYATGDLVRVEASATVPRSGTFYATRDFTADAADAQVDITAGNLTVLVYDGKPAQTMRGAYNAALTYAVGDVVESGGTRYQLFTPTPAGSTPGEPVFSGGQFSFPWGQLTLRPLTSLRLWGKGKPTASLEIKREMIDQVGAFNIHFVGTSPYNSSKIVAGTAATAVTTFNVLRNGTIIGSFRFAANAKEATFATVATGAPTYLSLGDVISIVAPATPDATLADIVGFLVIGQG